MIRANTARRKNERGVTIALVAVSLVALLGLAALAIDVTTLYVAHSEAQRAADAAALAGARMFAASGYTSASPSWAAADVCQTSGPGASAGANKQAEAVAAQNLIAGQAAAVQNIVCNVTAENPQITVTVQRTGLPGFFGKIWGRASNTVSATASAEAYNPSGSTAPIGVESVKPWLITNCDPTNTAGPHNPNCPGQSYFVDPADGSIANNGSFIGRTMTLRRISGSTPPAVGRYYALDVDPVANICPSGGAVSCGSVGSNDYLDNIACASKFQYTCTQTVGPAQAVKALSTGGLGGLTRSGARCLIHANDDGFGQDQDIFTSGGSSPVTITGGDNNPNPALRGVANISRSDSVITAPLYDGSNLCPGGACNVTTAIVGFIQLGIRRTIDPGGGGQPQLDAVILNVSGCNPGAAGTAISGGGVSPVPVRLIHQ